MFEYVVYKITEISSISNTDYIKIVANYYCLLTGERDNEIDLLKRGYTEEQIKKLKKPDKFTNIMGLTYTQSLTKYVYHNINYICLLFDNYEKGNLPFDGPISEQPAQIIEMLNLMSSLKIDITNKRNKEAKHG